MRAFVFITQTVPAWIAYLSEPFVRGWRWLWCLPIAGFVIQALFHVGKDLPNWIMGAGLIVGFAHLSTCMPWEDINRAVAYMFRPRWQRTILKHVDKVWPIVARETGLSHRNSRGEWADPPLYGLDIDDNGLLTLRPGLRIGNTIETLEQALEPIRLAIGAQRGKVRTDATRNSFEYVFSYADALANVTPRELPSIETASPVDTAILGVTEDGDAWQLPLRVSTLTAGATGSGKGSIMWGLVIDQAPNVAAGLVQLHGIDLKGGMELSLGLPLFTRYATDPAQAVVLLEEAAQACQERAKRLAGTTRMHTATADDPMVMVIIDELATVVAYLPDRDLTRRAEAALSILLTQGRAVGYYVFGFLQDPRKEVLKIRNLFTQSIALRLKEREEAAMVLSAEAVRSGAECHHIPRDMPGTGYILDEEGQVTRVRAAYCDDELIRATAATFPTPTRIPIVVPEPEPKARRRTTRMEGNEAA